MNKHIDYNDYLLASLIDGEEAAGYLSAALQGGDLDVFLLALRNVIMAQGGIKTLANQTNKSRTSLYKTLGKAGNPTLKGMYDILQAIGFTLAVIPDQKFKKTE